MNAVNDAPSFTAGADPTHNEDAGTISMTSWATGISAGPSDEALQSLVFIISNDNASLFASPPTVSAAGDLSYTLANNVDGSALVTLHLKDNGGTQYGGIDTSATRTFTITVNSVNDAPSFTKGNDQVVDEDAGPQTEIAWATDLVAGPTPQELTQEMGFVIAGNSNPALFSAAPTISASGTLTFTPTPDANGSATISVYLQDDGGTAYGGANTSGTQAFTITVNAINDTPSFTKGADPAVYEDSGAHTVAGWATNLSAGPDDESGQGLVFVMTGNTNPSLFSAAPTVSSAGALSFTPAADAFGSASVSVAIRDSLGAQSAAQTFAIAVTAVQEVPSAPGVALLPAAYKPGDALYATLTTLSVDADGDPITYSYQWTRDGVGQSYASTVTVVPGGDVDLEETWNVVVTPNDGYGDGATGWALVTIPLWSETSLVGAPAGRYDFSMVWTGQEMFVWGGYAAMGVITNTGGRYVPATDTWLPTNTTGALTARHGAMAVWNGREVIVWGGLDASIENYLSTGARYNPAADDWAATADSSGVLSRYGTAVWTGKEMIVWGGGAELVGFGFLMSNTGSRYNPLVNNWTNTSTTSGPTARAFHTAVWTGEEMLIWGGVSDPGGRYEPDTDSWTAISTLAQPTSSWHHTAVWTGSEMIVWGGVNSFGSTTGLNTGGRYHPRTDTWTSMATPTLPGRAHHTAVWTGREMILWGGTSDGSYFNDGGRYDPLSDTWGYEQLAPATEAGRSRHGAVWTGREMVVWGGDPGNKNSGLRYTPPRRTEAWLSTLEDGTTPAARSGHVAAWTGAEMLVWGGAPGAGGRYAPATDTWLAMKSSVDDVNAPAASTDAAAVWTGRHFVVWGGYTTDVTHAGGRYDPSTDSWLSTSVGANVPSARRRHTAVWTGKDMIVWGGENTVYEDTGGRYDPLSDVWSTVDAAGGAVPAARNAHTAVWTGQEMIVWGGYHFDGVTESHWQTGGRYDPWTDTWTATDIAGGHVPGGRSSHGAVWTGREMVVWGGQDDLAYFGDGGRYDPRGDTWLPIDTAGQQVPAARYGHSSVWTGRDLIVWGGRSAGVDYEDTGARYDPFMNTWRSFAGGVGTVPAGRNGHTAVWTGTDMIVWGGSENSSLLSSGGRYAPPRP